MIRNIMPSRIAPLLLLATSITAAAQTAPVIHRLDGSTLQAKEAEAIASAELKRDNVMGAQIAVLNGGKLVWSYAYGLRDAEHKLPMQTETSTWAGSITKGLFATWLMRRVERGEFDLDKPLAQMLPKPLDSYDDYKVSGVELAHDPQWPRITPRMLLFAYFGAEQSCVAYRA